MKRLVLGLLSLSVSFFVGAVERPDELVKMLKAQGIETFDTVQEGSLEDLNLETYVTEAGFFYYDKTNRVLFTKPPVALVDGEVRDMNAGLNKVLLNKIPEGAKLLFKSPNEFARIQVFTDFTCSWCKRMHGDIAQYNEAGVTIEYIPYPRAGIGSEVAKVMSGMLESDKGASLFSLAFSGHIDPSLGRTPVVDGLKESYKISKMLGVNSTPTLFIDGLVVAGYMEPEGVINSLREMSGLSPIK